MPKSDKEYEREDRIGTAVVAAGIMLFVVFMGTILWFGTKKMDTSIAKDMVPRCQFMQKHYAELDAEQKWKIKFECERWCPQCGSWE